MDTGSTSTTAVSQQGILIGRIRKAVTRQQLTALSAIQKREFGRLMDQEIGEAGIEALTVERIQHLLARVARQSS